MFLELRKLAAGVCLAAALASPAQGAMPGGYSDVAEGSRYASDVMYVTDMGIMSGVGNNYFQPQREVTGQELALMLCRFNSVDATWMNCVTRAVQEGYYEAAMVDYAGRAIPYDLARRAIYQAAGLDPGSTDSMDTGEGLSRSEAAHMLVRVAAWNQMNIKITAEPGYESVATKTRDRMMMDVPLEILERMSDDGWSIDVGGTYIKEYMKSHAEKGYTNVIGLTTFSKKTIHVTTSDAIMHECGHVWDKVMRQYQNSGELFKSERLAGQALLGKYSTTTQLEFIAEAFRYYNDSKYDEVLMAAMRKAIPNTYDMIVKCEANGWYAPVTEKTV